MVFRVILLFWPFRVYALKKSIYNHGPNFGCVESKDLVIQEKRTGLGVPARCQQQHEILLVISDHFLDTNFKSFIWDLSLHWALIKHYADSQCFQLAIILWNLTLKLRANCKNHGSETQPIILNYGIMITMFFVWV